MQLLADVAGNGFELSLWDLLWAPVGRCDAGYGVPQRAKILIIKTSEPSLHADQFLLDSYRLAELQVGDQARVLVLLQRAARARQPLTVPVVPRARR